MIVTLPSSAGYIEVICGSMFSGKTQELIRRLRLAQIAQQRVQVFNSKLDTRYGRSHIISHDKSRLRSRSCKSSRDIVRLVKPDTRVVGIDEVHFFDDGVIEAAQRLADEGKRVVCAGLDTDYKGRPFEITAKLMALAEFVTKNLAICVSCGNPANRSQRLRGGRRRIEVGAADKYEARCRRCYDPGHH